jgi:hypothetical protein
MPTSFFDGDLLPSALRQRDVCRARAIDVEDLVRWAVVSQLPRGSALSATTWDRIDYWRRVREDEEKRRKRSAPIWEKPERSSRLCALARNHARSCNYSVSAHIGVATTSVCNSLGYLAGTPDDDAIAIGLVLAELRREDKKSNGYCIRDKVLFTEVIEEFGKIDSHGVLAALRKGRFALNRAETLNRCAVLGCRPKWDVGLPRPHQEKRRTRGRAYEFVLYEDADGNLREQRKDQKRGGYPAWIINGGRSPLIWGDDRDGAGDPTVEVLMEARAAYAIWHCALIDLVSRLEGRLINYVALVPKAPRSPWLLRCDARFRESPGATIMGEEPPIH